MSSRLKQIPESLIARLWMERASLEKSLRAGDGRRFRVLYPGRVGTTAGPDFRGAVLEEEGVGLVRGHVEVHVSQGQWEAHGHGRDTRYNGVVSWTQNRPHGYSPAMMVYSSSKCLVSDLSHDSRVDGETGEGPFVTICKV